MNQATMAACIAAISFLQGFSGELAAQQCGTDALHHRLVQQYPDGYPGRTPAATDKTDDYLFSYVIPVVVHIMDAGGPEGLVTYPQVISQINVLNEDYNRYGRGFNTDPVGADIQIRFCLATVDPSGQPTQGYEFVDYPGSADVDPYTEDDALKEAASWDPKRYLNIYVVRRIGGATVKGYAFFPDEVAGTFKDGVVIDYRYFGSLAGTSASLGRTCSHEVGHYLGLYHPWGLNENGCFDEDDDCDDTPTVESAVFATFPNCNGGASCDGGSRQVENYMDYSADGCMNLFTQCQADKMRSAIARYRGRLVSGDNLASLGCQTISDTLPATGGDLLVFPVPAADNLEVFPIAAQGAPVNYRVFDPTGRRVLEGTVTNTRAPFYIDLSRFTNGIYVLEVGAGEQLWIRKILVDH
jgi:Pregnancy-associated plasma protein-A/Secretion system C-terminal sorting domain